MKKLWVLVLALVMVSVMASTVSAGARGYGIIWEDSYKGHGRHK